jgi:ABC-2 type transport system ATP-binding protein
MKPGTTRPWIRSWNVAVRPGSTASAEHRQVASLSVGSTLRFYQIDPPSANRGAPTGPLVCPWYDERAMPASSLAVEARDLTKTFRSGWFGRRETAALRGASLQVERGAIFGLLGPNGAGKTTLLSILATLLLPDSGSAAILGHDVVREAFMARRRLNMASGNASFVWSLRPAEVLSFYGRLYGLHGRALRARVDALLERFELTSHLRTEYNELSTGLKQRLALAKALLNDPEVLFLDEPTLGLDPDVSIRIRAQIAELRRERGTTIILTTHYLREAEELCDRIAFIKGGRILAEGSADELKRQIRIGDVIALRLDPATPVGLGELAGVLQVAPRGDRIECTVDSSEKRLPEILRWLCDQGVLIRDCQIHEPELEEVFVELAR